MSYKSIYPLYNLIQVLLGEILTTKSFKVTHYAFVSYNDVDNFSYSLTILIFLLISPFYRMMVLCCFQREGRGIFIWRWHGIFIFIWYRRFYCRWHGRFCWRKPNFILISITITPFGGDATNLPC